MIKCKALNYVLLVCVIASGSCKYDEGPCISFRSTEERLSGHYIIDKIEVDNDNLTQEYRDACNCDFYFPQSSDDGVQFHLFNCKGVDLTNRVFGEYSLLGSSNMHIKFYGKSNYVSDSAYGYGPFNYNSKSVWKIHRCTMKETIIEAYYYGKKYRVEMHEIE